MKRMAIFLILALTRLAAAETRSVQFVMLVPDVSADQPPRIFMSLSLDSWPERGRPLERVAPGVYSATLDLSGGTELEYKFTRAGSWDTVEKAADGAELPNRRLTVATDLTEQVIVNRVDRWADRPRSEKRRVEFGTGPGTLAPITTRASTLTGDIRFHRAFHSPQLNNDRTLIVYLPPGYDEHPSERYPVLYVHDGQNLFDAATSFAGEWQADETATRLIKAGELRPLIIVGIYNNAERMAEYSPTRDPARGGGNGDAYLAFIVETVKPFIDQTYRTRPGRTDTGVAGSSLGGLISLYAAYKYPQVFGCTGVISPTLMWGGGAILDYVRAHKPAEKVKLWLEMGTEEMAASAPGEPSRAVQDCRELVKILAAQGYRPEVDFHYDEVEGARHNEASWSQRFDRVLIFLMGPP